MEFVRFEGKKSQCLQYSCSFYRSYVSTFRGLFIVDVIYFLFINCLFIFTFGARVVCHRLLCKTRFGLYALEYHLPFCIHSLVDTFFVRSARLNLIF